MAANTSVTLTNLDFDTYKNQLKNYLKGQTVFKDYDFEASQLSVLLDLLALNTYQNGFYLNMVGNEMFLDTAQLRDSIVSHAKELNYTPRSFASARARIKLTIISNNPNKTALSIPKGTRFSTRIGNQSYMFSTHENIAVNEIDHYEGTSPVFIAEVDIFEGTYLQETYSSNQQCVISNERVDLSSLTVMVIEDNGAVTHAYLKAESLFGHDSESMIYFTQGYPGNRYEVVFGDGVSGRPPKDNSLVVLEYRISSGELPNGAKVFQPVSTIDGEADIQIDLVAPASAGSVAESNESIRFNAPRHFSTQERAVTTEDYENLLKANFPEVNAVTAFGGEEVSPPQFGKVFIALDLIDLDFVPDTYKTIYYDFIKARTPLSIDPVFVNPEYLYIRVNSTVNYDTSQTSATLSDIQQFVIESIQEFSDTNLNGFGKVVRYSRLIEAIDDTAKFIVSNETILDAYKRLRLYDLSQQSLTLNFGFPISNMESDVIQYAGQPAKLQVFDDIVSIYSGGARVLDIGSIDKEAGIINLSRFEFDQILETIRIFVTPVDLDIVPPKNTIVAIRSDDVIVNPVKT